MHHFTSSLRMVFLLVAIQFCQISLGQTQEKIYYDIDWRVTSKQNASFYRILKRSKTGAPVSPVRDYYITGELQWEGNLTHVDGRDNKKDIRNGEATWFHKNGFKSQQCSYVNNVLNGVLKTWGESGELLSELNYLNDKLEGAFSYYHRNGNRASEGQYKNNKLHGSVKYYHSNGQLNYSAQYREGKLTNYWIEHFDDQGKKLGTVFNDKFLDYSNPNSFTLSDNNKAVSRFTDAGLSLRTKQKTAFAAWYPVPGNYDDIYAFLTEINFVSGSKDFGAGIVFHFSDWNNYAYFTINKKGYAILGTVVQGKRSEASKYVGSISETGNVIQLRFTNTMFVYVNGKQINNFKYSTGRQFSVLDLQDLPGSQMGLFVNGDIGEAVFSALELAK